MTITGAASASASGAASAAAPASGAAAGAAPATAAVAVAGAAAAPVAGQYQQQRRHRQLRQHQPRRQLLQQRQATVRGHVDGQSWTAVVQAFDALGARLFGLRSRELIWRARATTRNHSGRFNSHPCATSGMATCTQSRWCGVRDDVAARANLVATPRARRPHRDCAHAIPSSLPHPLRWRCPSRPRRRSAPSRLGRPRAGSTRSRCRCGLGRSPLRRLPPAPRFRWPV
jgi:hypothetical protein